MTARVASRRHALARGAARLAVLGLLYANAGCTPPAPSLGEVALWVDDVWGPPPGPATSPLAPRVPKGVVIRWAPASFSPSQIQAVAARECARFHRAAHALGPPAAAGALNVQRFACVHDEGLLSDAQQRSAVAAIDRGQVSRRKSTEPEASA